ncbi:MAG: ArnT family glycosyltransferase [Chthoniobacterales bacterium]
MSSTRGRLWLLWAVGIAAVAVRLIAINQPFIDPWSWRQADVAAIARNYSETGFHFAYPQIDWSGGDKGYVGSEFPILPFTAAVIYRITGVQEWVGRSQAVFFFALSIPFFIALVAEIFGEAASVWALLFYAFAPLALMASRCFMPDIPSLSLSIVGLYCFRSWITEPRPRMFIVAALSTSLAILIKLPTAIIGLPLACVALENFGLSVLRRPSIWLFAVIALVPALFWYFHAWHISREFPPHHFFGDGGIRLMSLKWYLDIVLRILQSSLTWAPCLLALVGLSLGRRAPSKLFHWWLAAFILFLVVAGYGNRHPWYQLPLVPLVAAFAGHAMNRILSPIHSGAASPAIVGVVMLIFAEQTLFATLRLFRPAAADLRDLGSALKQRTPPGSLVVIADYGDPTGLYYAHRKGWHFSEKEDIYNGHPPTDDAAIADLEHLRQQGATHIAFYSGTRWWLDYYKAFADHLRRSSVPVESNGAYEIFQLGR